MKFSHFKFNIFVFFKVPSAYLSGVRVVSVEDEQVIVKVRHRWINQNPFKSMYWATQGMASELATGILMMQRLQLSSQKISMLVVEQKGIFLKKATGKIIFKCIDYNRIDKCIAKAISTGEGQVLVLSSNGVDETGDIVSSFDYHWSIKVKSI